MQGSDTLTTASKSPFEAAFAYAAELDAVIAQTTDDDLCEFLHGVADKLENGFDTFTSGLNWKIGQIEQADEGDAEYAPYAGGWVSTGNIWLSAAAEDEMEDCAIAWLKKARELIGARVAGASNMENV